MSGAGTSSATQNTNYGSNFNQQTAPWQPTQGTLNNIIGGINQQQLSPTGGQEGAAQNLVSSANAIPNLGPQVARALGQYLNPNYINPMSNPYLGPAINAQNQQIATGINQQFAGAGRDPSGNAQSARAIAYGQSQADLPLLLGQYNTNVGQQMGAINATPSIAQNYLAPGLAQQGAATNQAQLPLVNTLAAEQGALPLAALGSQTSGNQQGYQNTQGTQTMSPLQQVAMLFGGGAKSPFSGASGAASGGIGILGSLFG